MALGIPPHAAFAPPSSNAAQPWRIPSPSAASGGLHLVRGHAAHAAEGSSKDIIVPTSVWHWLLVQRRKCMVMSCVLAPGTQSGVASRTLDNPGLSGKAKLPRLCNLRLKEWDVGLQSPWAEGMGAPELWDTALGQELWDISSCKNWSSPA